MLPPAPLHYESSERVKNYKSKFYMDLVEENKEQKEMKEKEKLHKKHLAEKANSYAKYVREMYGPTVPEEKENLR